MRNLRFEPSLLAALFPALTEAGVSIQLGMARAERAECDSRISGLEELAGICRRREAAEHLQELNQAAQMAAFRAGGPRLVRRVKAPREVNHRGDEEQAAVHSDSPTDPAA